MMGYRWVEHTAERELELELGCHVGRPGHLVKAAIYQRPAFKRSDGRYLATVPDV